ncbi:hypothetical protein ACOSP6_01810 [Tenacibaculum sp. MEBiC06402]|uniref:hypothetical protein n=1 Tax=unclassified Tenacibaculum TaxID=2635139 RepID=UPI003B9D5CB6
MRLTFMEDLKNFELTKEEQIKIYAKGGKLDGGVNTDGDEDCFPLADGKTKKKKDGTVCI